MHMHACAYMASYGFNPLRMLSGSEDAAASVDKKAFFCSELVAALYKVMGLLPSDTVTNHYLPGAFAEDIKLQLDASLAPALLLQFGAVDPPKK
jgi:hypothetical protein